VEHGLEEASARPDDTDDEKVGQGSANLPTTLPLKNRARE
jgi:hypothetical protein